MGKRDFGESRYQIANSLRSVTSPRGPDRYSVLDAMRAGSHLDLDRPPHRRDVRVGQGRRPRRRWSTELAVVSDLQTRLFAEKSHGPVGRAAGHGRRWQGRHDPHRLVRRQPCWCEASPASTCRPKTNYPTTTCGASTAWLPARGQIVIFNRSHYEDVLVVRVHLDRPDRVPAWALSPDPRLRADAGRPRNDGRQIVPAHLQGRAEAAHCRSASTVPTSAGSSAGAINDRARWDDFMTAFRRRAARHLHRRRAVVRRARRSQVGAQSRLAHVLRHHLERLDPQYPEPEEGIEGLVVT